MAIISHTQKFIYFLNPRTASTATAQALLAATDSTHIPAEDILDNAGRILVPRKHTTLRQIVRHQLIAEDKLEDYFKFVTVRNPFDSLVSIWSKKVNEYVPLLKNPDSWVNRKPGFADGLRRAAGLSFGEWIRKEYAEMAEQGKKSAINGPFIQGTDEQLRYEALDDSIARVRDQIGLSPDFAVPQLNVTRSRERKDYRSYYDDHAVEIISIVFGDELSALDYAF